MKKLFLLFIGLIWAVQGWAGFYDEIMVNGVKYRYYYNYYEIVDHAMVVSIAPNHYSGDIEIAGSINVYVDGTYRTFPVTDIFQAFKNCTELTSVTIPNSVTRIGLDAFNGCSLTSITLPPNVNEVQYGSFKNCTQLKRITCTGPVPETYENAFDGVPSDMLIYVPIQYYTDYLSASPWNDYNLISESFCVENEGHMIYYQMTSSLNVSVTSSSDPNYCYTGNINIPSTVTYEGKTYSVTGVTECAFFNSSNLVSVSLPNTITDIGHQAFQGCTSLTSIVIPDYVTNIGTNAFKGCTSIASVTLGNTASNIEESAFSGCTSLSTINWTAVNVASYPAYSSTDSRHPFYGCNNITTVNFTGAVQSIPHDAFNGVSSINSINIGSSVTTIGDRAFNNCSGIGSVTLGASVSTIGEKAFCGCSGMTFLSIDNLLTEVGISAFEGCTSLSQAIVLPPFVTKVRNRAFFGCSGITSLTLGINVNTLGNNAFNNCTSLASVEWKSLEITTIANDAQYAPFLGCTNLTNLTFGNTVRSIPDFAFMGTSIASTTLPNALQTIGKYAFQGVSTMSQELTIPNNVTSIGEYAFKGCSSLTKVTFGSGITNLGKYSFRECTGLSQNLIIPNSVTTIGEGAFYGCSSLTGVAIGSGVTAIGNLAFNGCSSLSAITWNATNVTSYPTEDNMLPFISCPNFNTINIGNGVTNIPAKAFLSCTTVTTANIGNSLTSIPDNAFYNCSSLASINIPNSVTNIGISAFKYCVGIETINMPSVTSIGASAFDGCVSLSYLAVPEGVATIGDYTFQNCSSLESASLPSTITSVGASAFKNDVSLSTMRCFAASVPSANTNAFENVSSSMNLQVPQSSVAAYQATSPWSNFNITGVVSHTITATASPATGGTISGVGGYAFGSTATLTATANPDYAFTNWTENNIVISTNPQISFTVTGDRTLVANFTFITNYNISVVANPSAGGSVSGGGSYLGNTTATVVANANTGYDFVNWEEGGNSVSTDLSYSFTVTNDRNLFANFNIQTFDITASANNSDHGTVTGGGTFDYGTTATLTATPNSGYTFVNWTENDEIVSTNATYNFTVNADRNLVANFNAVGTEKHWIPDQTLYADNMSVIGIIQINDEEQRTTDLEIGAFCGDEVRGSQRPQYISGSIDRYIFFLTVYGQASNQITFKLYDHSLGEELDLSSPAAIAFVANGTTGSVGNPHIMNFTSGQDRELTSGWNWYSTYIDVSGASGLTMMENGLGTDAMQIKSQTAFVTYDYGMWYGALTAVNVEQMYMIQMNAAHTLNMSGSVANASAHPISISNGWKWIGYPVNQTMSIDAALANFTPHNGDYIKSQTGFSQYYEGIGWLGALSTLSPGNGYMYQNTSGSAKTLVYATPSKSDVLGKNITPKGNHWEPDMYQYANNMSIVAALSVNGELQNTENIEVAAFCNGECRGSAKPMFIEQLDKYVVFLTVYGNENDEIVFRLYDAENNEEFAGIADEIMTFAANGTIGSVSTPYIINFGFCGISEMADNSIEIYPNPANKNSEIQFGENCEKIEVFNSIGAKIAEYQNVSKIEGFATAGVYVIRVTNGEKSCNQKLIIK